MRDINRIKPFVDELEKLWNIYPDWRFGQFMLNFLGLIARDSDRDIFYIEDTDMLEIIKRYINDSI